MLYRKAIWKTVGIIQYSTKRIKGRKGSKVVREQVDLEQPSKDRATYYLIIINQLNAQIKIMEIWKAKNIEDYPLKLNKKEVVTGNINTRACTQGKLIVPGTKPIMQRSCITDAIRLWNKLPTNITSAPTLATAKKASKAFVKALPA